MQGGMPAIEQDVPSKHSRRNRCASEGRTSKVGNKFEKKNINNKNKPAPVKDLFLKVLHEKLEQAPNSTMQNPRPFSKRGAASQTNMSLASLPRAPSELQNSTNVGHKNSNLAKHLKALHFSINQKQQATSSTRAKRLHRLLAKAKMAMETGTLSEILPRRSRGPGGAGGASSPARQSQGTHANKMKNETKETPAHSASKSVFLDASVQERYLSILKEEVSEIDEREEKILMEAAAQEAE